MSLSKELENRGFIHQCSADITEVLDGPRRTIYHGVDPTADSIHAGNFASWMLLRHLKDAGHKVILLIGGGTGMIGDPKPDVERPLTPPAEVAKRVEKLSRQAKQLLGDEVMFVNNHDWLGELKLIDFLRDIGKHFTVNELIKKDAIATRLKSDNGISYTEFAYPLLQGFDFLELYKKYGCDVQVGGSDQWGNIISGVELVRKKEQKTVYAITTPLIIDKSTGKKFGKSEGNAVWLDAEKTSPFAFYQFWLNVGDENVIDYLKIFTRLPLEVVASLEIGLKNDPGARVAQKCLAEEITSAIHGKETATTVANVSEVIFGNRALHEMTSGEREILTRNAPTTKVALGITIVDVLVDTGLASSKREARTFVESGAVSVNAIKCIELTDVLEARHFSDKLAILKRGKKQVHILEI
ncbi:MAG: tyrosine--tRNA ligase [Candidatus Pacebacteria bacterium]|nr:tyrosine--tRNA ligase [Candidatus Paceibacterota bacterium]MBP9842964.1 tyrosine--tRNA ligase [Candidatus Paceibacterota bacterium]